MPKYLFIGNYTAQGAAGLLKEGGSARRAAIEQAVASVGGTVDFLYWGFGADDIYSVADLPNHAAAAAASLTISSSGAAETRTIPLITAEEMDAASKMSPSFRPPGA